MPFPTLVPGSLTTRTASMLDSRLLIPENNRIISSSWQGNTQIITGRSKIQNDYYYDDTSISKNNKIINLSNDTSKWRNLPSHQMGDYQQKQYACYHRVEHSLLPSVSCEVGMPYQHECDFPQTISTSTTRKKINQYSFNQMTLYHRFAITPKNIYQIRSLPRPYYGTKKPEQIPLFWRQCKHEHCR